MPWFGWPPLSLLPFFWTLWSYFTCNPEDPKASVLKIARRVHSVPAVSFGTEIRKRYGQDSEMLFSPRRKEQKNGTDKQNYGHNKILQILAP